jgi:membrane-associated phospholipid phosphatase
MRTNSKKSGAAALLLLLCLMAQFCAGTLAAATDEEKSEPQEQTAVEKKPGLFRDLWEDEKDIWTSPFHMKSKQFLTAGIVLLTTGILITQDEAIARNVMRFHDQHRWVHLASKSLTQLGGGYAWGIAGLFAIDGLLAKDVKARETGIMGLEAMLHSGLVVQFSKFMASRERPDATGGNDNWLGPAGIPKHFQTATDDQYSSFFSGHATAAFSLATVIASQYRNHGWVPPLCYALAGLVALTRMVEYRHWCSDVFVGSVVGFAIGKMVVRNHRNRRMLLPTVSFPKDGMALGFVF